MKLVRGLVVIVSAGSLFLALPAGAQPKASLVRASAEIAMHLERGLPVVKLTLSQPEPVSSLPRLVTTPAVATRWVAVGPHQVAAIALQTPPASAPYRIEVPATWNCAATCTLTKIYVVNTHATLNSTWTAQLLAELNYLPVSFTSPAGPFAVAEVPGTFHWRFNSLTTLKPLWNPAVTNPILTGALMRFEDVHGLPTTGLADSATWSALLRAVQLHQVNPATYNNVVVSQTQPESLVLYQNGTATLHATVNTGISQSPTQVGTYPVYLRYVTQTMRGTNPNGTKYVDPGIPWVSYFYGGDALHGFIRASYGYPQSLGCVEMPFATAGVLWPHTPIGTPVTVLP